MIFIALFGEKISECADENSEIEKAANCQHIRDL